MGRSDRDARCMKHTDHRQSKGVCPYCLRERLYHLSCSSSSSEASSMASSLSVSSSDDSELSSCNVSPPSFRKKTSIVALFKRVSSSRAPFVKPGVSITKSRSLVFAVGGKQLAETEKDPRRGGKMGGRSSWFKLLRGGSRWSKGKERVSLQQY